MQAESNSATGTPLFTVKQVKAMSTFISRGIVQNLEAYQYVCNEAPTEVIVNRTITVQTPLLPYSTMLSCEEVAAAAAKAAHSIEAHATS